MKTIYRLTLRALQGFTQSLRGSGPLGLAGAELHHVLSPDKTLDVELPILLDNEPIHLVVDSTGLKVYGAGEWKVPPARLLEAAHVA
ncbi:MAG: transposase [Burkholderia sp.]|nr:MAG: hypothetical protein E5299_01342 [Burkholderia gladioli]